MRVAQRHCPKPQAQRLKYDRSLAIRENNVAHRNHFFGGDCIALTANASCPITSRGAM